MVLGFFKMPNWVEKTIKGALICAICGSQVLQFGQLFTCTGKECSKHDDEPIRQHLTVGFWVEPRAAQGTASAVGTNIGFEKLL